MVGERTAETREVGSALTAELLLLGDLGATLLKSGVEGMDLGQTM